MKDFLGIAQDVWPSKCHIYIFGDKTIWDEFYKKPGERLPGAEAYTNGPELFIYCDLFFLAPQKTLAHEITHIVLHRFIKGTPPLFLNEGFAEFMAYKAIAQQTDGNEFAMRTIQMIPPENVIPLKELVEMRDYPAAKEIFYQESELLVRYLILNYDQKHFFDLLSQTSDGVSFSSALNSIYGLELDKLEPKFLAYAVALSQK